MKEEKAEKHPSPRDPVADIGVNVDTRRVILVVFVTCLAAELVFVLLDATVNYSHWTNLGMIRRMFNITREDGMASWFGTTQTFMVALTLWCVWLLTSREAGASRRRRVGWLILAILFTYMAVDDGSEIHERLGSAFKALNQEGSAGAAAGSVGSKLLKAFPSYPWQILFVPMFGAAGIFMVWFLWRELHTRFSFYLVFSGLVLFAVGTGLDFSEGLDQNHPMNVCGMITGGGGWEEFTREQFGQKSYESCRHFGKSVEEFFEMSGMTLIWVAFLYHLATRYREIHFRLRPPTRA